MHIKNETLFWILSRFYGLGLLAWPFLSYGVIFTADNPNGNQVYVQYLIYTTWLYPVFYIIGYYWGHHKRNRSKAAILLKTSFPLLSAQWYITIALLHHSLGGLFVFSW